MSEKPRLTETLGRVMNAARMGAKIWHPVSRSGGAVYVAPAEAAAATYRIQYRTLDKLIALGLLKKKSQSNVYCHYVIVEGTQWGERRP